ncbi:MAG: hypothetical protein GXO36_00100, partial [Chloroflexi bacterium]|nr:hypothetical protein [Chloroflexota bacterium]
EAEAGVEAEGRLEVEVPEEIFEDEEAALAWLEQLAAKQGAPLEELVSFREEGEGPEAEAPVAEVEAEAEAEAPAAAVEAEAEAEEALEAGELPEWLTGLAEEAAAQVEAAAPEAAVEPSLEEEALPEWLSGLEAEAAPSETMEAEALSSEDLAAETRPLHTEDLAEWLTSLDAMGAEEAAEETVLDVQALEAGTEPEAILEEGDAAFAWLEQLVAEQSTLTEETPPEEAPAAQDWTTPQEPVQEVPAELLRAETQPLQVENLPEWLDSLTFETEEVPEEEAAPQAEAPGEARTGEEALPEWLTGMAEVPSEAAEEAAQAEAPLSGEPGFEAEALPEWLLGVAGGEPGAWLPMEETEAEVAPESEAELAGEATILEGEAGPTVWEPERETRELTPAEETHAGLDWVEEVVAKEEEEIALPEWVRDLQVPPRETMLLKPLPAGPERYRERLLKARQALAEDNLDEALKHYRYLIRRRKFLDQIIEDLQQAQYYYPMSVDLLQLLGDALQKQGRLQEALDVYLQAEELLQVD